MGYIGRDNSLDTFTKQSITANGGTSFTLDQGVGDSSSILVSIGGIVQQPDVAYTASGTALTFTSAPTNAYPIWVVYLGKELTVSSELSYDNCDTQVGVGNGTATPITLDNSVSSVNDIIVTLNGIAQKPGTDFTASGTTLTFTTAPSAAMNILVYYLALGGGDNIPSDMSVTSASQFAASGTWPAWNGSNLINAGGDATQADIDALIASLSTLSFLQNIDHSTALLNMVNGWSDTFITSASVHGSSAHRITHFDGVSDFLECSTSGLGVVDGKNFIISFYMKVEMDDGAQKTIMTTTNNRLQVYRSTDNKLGLVLENPSATEIAHIKSTRTITKSDGIVHCLIAVDMANTTVQMSINGAAVETNVVVTAVANDNIDFTDGNLRIGNRAGTVYFEGLLGQIYLTQEYLDISSSLNRQKFYNDGVVDFSSNGSTPTGNQPRIYLNNPADSISINHGSGGNFTPNGGGGGVFVDGGYINDSIYSSSNDSFTNSYELIQRFGKNNVNFPNGFTVGDHKKAGQCITLPACSISKIGFWVRRVGSISGPVKAEIHGVTGTPGSSATSNGIILAQSNSLETSSLSTTMHLMTFDFPSSYVHSGGNLWIGINAFSMSGGGSTYLHMMQNVNNADTDGNAAKQAQNLAWTGYASNDILYYVFGTKNIDIVTKGTNDLSTTDSPASAPSKGHIEALVNENSYYYTLLASGTAIAHSHAGSNTAASAFDNDTGTYWIANETAAAGTGISYIGYDNGSGNNIELGKFTILGRQNGNSDNWCSNVIVRYSDDGNTWTNHEEIALSTTYGTTAQELSVTSGAGAHRYWSLLANADMGVSSSWGIAELEFYKRTAVVPSLNTDVIGELSRDGGTTWSPATLARSSTGINGAAAEILSGDVDFTGDPSGTNVVGRIRTANKHKVIVEGISVNWS